MSNPRTWGRTDRFIDATHLRDEHIAAWRAW